MDLGRFPRECLAHLPTPLEPLARLSAALDGPEIWVKRDDCTGLALGGNKTRKLEFLMGDALSRGADTVITTGGLQSNHVRQTAAAAARLGLSCELVLTRNVPGRDADYERTGNLQLDRLLGARLHVRPGEADRDAAMAEIAEAVRVRGARPYVIPLGGSNAVGALGYVAAADELLRQAPEVDAVVLASSSGGTQAGLAVGLAALGHGARVIGIEVDGDPDGVERAVRAVTMQTAQALGIAPETALAGVEVVTGYAGDGYGLPSDAMTQAVERLARTEGLILDPVYSGKAMAGLIGLIGSGAFRRGARIIFLHTGGAPAIFAYRSAFAAD